MDCSCKKAHGCGNHGEKVLEGITLYVRTDYPYLTTTLSIFLSEEARRTGAQSRLLREGRDGAGAAPRHVRRLQLPAVQPAHVLARLRRHRRVALHDPVHTGPHRVHLHDDAGPEVHRRPGPRASSSWPASSAQRQGRTKGPTSSSLRAPACGR
jgi:hypothetical protein